MENQRNELNPTTYLLLLLFKEISSKWTRSKIFRLLKPSGIEVTLLE